MEWRKIPIKIQSDVDQCNCDKLVLRDRNAEWKSIMYLSNATIRIVSNLETFYEQEKDTDAMDDNYQNSYKTHNS